DAMAQGNFEEEPGEVVILLYERNGEVYALARRNADLPLAADAFLNALEGDGAYHTTQATTVGDVRLYLAPLRLERPLPPGLRGVGPGGRFAVPIRPGAIAGQAPSQAQGPATGPAQGAVPGPVLGRGVGPERAALAVGK